MDKKTSYFMGTGVALIIVLFLVIAVNHAQKELYPKAVASHEAVKPGDAVKAGAADEKATEKTVAEKADEKAHGADVKAAKSEDKAAEKDGEEKVIAAKTEDKKEPVAEKKAEEKKAEKAPAAAAVSAEGLVEMIKMETEGYESHKKGIVTFSHKKHFVEYKISCGDCHHDDGGQPLKDLKPGDEVQKCIECHSNPGQSPKGKGAPKLTDQQKREYHAEALHDNCIVCHRDYNKANNTKAAPTSCGKCHPKN